MQSIVGRCGLYCGACTVYRAQRDSKELQERLANSYQCKTEQVCCNGCNGLTESCWGNGCKIGTCLQEKNLQFCYECELYQKGECKKFNSLADDYLTVGVDLRANLEKIKNGQVEEWLNESKEKFKCPHCGHPVSAWFSKCHKCGHQLK